MWIIIDSAGIYCVLLTYFFFAGVSFVVMRVSILPLSSEGYLSLAGAVTSYFFFILLALTCHVRCMLTDPGSVPIISTTLPICDKCSAPKPSRVHHCSTCKACILKMDHHCPWMNNCIGYFNQKHFVLFLFYSEICCLYSIILIVLRATYCMDSGKGGICDKSVQEHSADVLLGLMSLAVTGLFSLFILIMIVDQIKCISKNISGIEVLKQEFFEQRSLKVNFEETFGGRNKICWVLPFAVPGTVEEYLDRNTGERT